MGRELLWKVQGSRGRRPSWEPVALLGGAERPLLRGEGREARDSGVQEAVEGIVGRLQVEQHLEHLGVIQLVGRRHAAQGLQPGGREHRAGVLLGGASRAPRKGPRLTTG